MRDSEKRRAPDPCPLCGAITAGIRCIFCSLGRAPARFDPSDSAPSPSRMREAERASLAFFLRTEPADSDAQRFYSDSDVLIR